MVGMVPRFRRCNLLIAFLAINGMHCRPGIMPAVHPMDSLIRSTVMINFKKISEAFRQAKDDVIRQRDQLSVEGEPYPAAFDRLVALFNAGIKAAEEEDEAKVRRTQLRIYGVRGP
jgi:hypothetical protein